MDKSNRQYPSNFIECQCQENAEQDMNKPEGLLYLFFSLPSWSLGGRIVSPFSTTAEIAGVRQHVLIDTGADPSLIHSLILSCTHVEPEPSSARVVGANGQEISVKGEIQKFPITIFGKRIVIPQILVANTQAPSLIGVSAIKAYPFLLTNCFHNIKTPEADIRCLYEHLTYSLQDINDDTAYALTHTAATTISTPTVPKDVDPRFRFIISKFINLFQTEIFQYILCYAARHQIQTGTANPICAPIIRIPVHWIPLINEEIEKILNSEF
ncbi:hypothetical protein PAEPH01_2214 [Pancytospora epiphaga]|nr:hypothetical protein PAEPH01_2214 [Pancytospora epiphaga]